MGLDVAAIKADFPMLSKEIDGKRLVYLDSGATSQKPNAVIDAMDDYYRCLLYTSPSPRDRG